jgi:hypothetical protein
MQAHGISLDLASLLFGISGQQGWFKPNQKVTFSSQIGGSAFASGDPE